MTLTILLANSGSGKTTVENQFFVTSIIPTTTRLPRKGEINGIHNYFVTPEEFNINDMAATIQIGDNTNWKYGISKAELMEMLSLGEDRIISIISSKYAKDLADYAESIGIKVSIIYLYVSKEERIKRLTLRGESQDSINARLDFEDKLTLEELRAIFPNLIFINGEGTQEEVIQRAKEAKNGITKN